MIIVKAIFQVQEPRDPQFLVITNQFGDVLYEGEPNDAMLIAMAGKEMNYFEADYVGARIILKKEAPEQNW